MSPSTPRAFSLVELLAVLALLVIACALVLPAAGGLFRRNGNRSLEEQVTDVLQAVRRNAVQTGREVDLRFDGEEQRFIWNGGEFARLSGPRAAIDFLRATGRGNVLIGGELVETGAVPAVTFFPDGTCDRVRVQLRPATGGSRVLAIDPWTCAPGLEGSP